MKIALRTIIIVTVALVCWRLAIDLAELLKADALEREREHQEHLERISDDWRPTIPRRCFADNNDLWECMREKDRGDTGSPRSSRTSHNEVGYVDGDEARKAQVRKDL